MRLASGVRVASDYYVVAANPFAVAEILQRSPTLCNLDQLRLFSSLIEGGPHTQVSLRIAFREKVRWPRIRTALIAADSEFNLTLFAQEEVWDPGVELGDDVKSLWTITACVGKAPGQIYALARALHQAGIRQRGQIATLSLQGTECVARSIQ